MVELRNICDEIKDGDWIESKDQSDSGIRLVQTGNIGFGVYHNKDSRAKFITDKTFTDLKCTEIFEGDILISRLPSPVGRACVFPNIKERAITAVDCTILRINKAICIPKYFVYYTMSPMYLNQIDKFVAGTTRLRISRKNLEGIKVFLPEIEVQKKIVDILDKSKILLDKRKEQLDLLDELVKSRFIEMFGDIKRNPYGWESFKLEDLYEIIDGDRGKNYPKQDEFYDSEYCLFLNAGNVTSKGFSFRKNAFITKEKDEVLRKGKLERKDIVVTTRGTVGNIAYYDETVPFENIRINSGMVILRQKKEINHIFFIEYFKNPIVYQSLISGSAQPQMPISSMKNANIYIPPIELQNKFADFVKQVDKLKFDIEKSLKELEDNFNSLMQKAFKGELFND